jgi:hypothetical protein
MRQKWAVRYFWPTCSSFPLNRSAAFWLLPAQHLREGELVLVGTGGCQRDLDAADADPHQRADLEQLEADRTAGRRGKLRVPQGNLAQGADQHISHRRKP